MEETVTLDEVPAAHEPSNLDAGLQETSNDSMLILVDPADGPAIEEHPDMDSATRCVPEA